MTFPFQIVDQGVILHPGSYLREFWNIMDMTVVSCAVSSMIMDAMYDLPQKYKKEEIF